MNIVWCMHTGGGVLRNCRAIVLQSLAYADFAQVVVCKGSQQGGCARVVSRAVLKSGRNLLSVAPEMLPFIVPPC